MKNVINSSKFKTFWNYHVNKRKVSCKYVTEIITKKKIDL